MTDNQLKVVYVSHMGDDLTPVNSARISRNNKSEVLTEKDIKLLTFLADNGHYTPFEHCVVTVIIECPLYIRSQIMRHRTFSYNEVSRRYTDENIEFYIPDELRYQDTKNKQGSKGSNKTLLEPIRIICENALYTYDELIRKGIAREHARMVLPQNLMTKFYMTGNIRNWAHFLKLRSDSHAQKEVQIIAKHIDKILKKYYPECISVLLKNKGEK